MSALHSRLQADNDIRQLIAKLADIIHLCCTAAHTVFVGKNHIIRSRLRIVRRSARCQDPWITMIRCGCRYQIYICLHRSSRCQRYVDLTAVNINLCLPCSILNDISVIDSSAEIRISFLGTVRRFAVDSIQITRQVTDIYLCHTVHRTVGCGIHLHHYIISTGSGGIVPDRVGPDAGRVVFYCGIGKSRR